MPTVTMRYFAHAREPAGCADEALQLPAQLSALALRALLLARHPKLERVLPSCRIAHNLEFAGQTLMLADGDELALIPPVSGG